MTFKEELTKRDAFLDVPKDESILRGLLWIHHGCSSEYLYGDDGERQCSHPRHRTLNPFDYVDFRRDSADLLHWKLMNSVGQIITPRPER